MASDNPSKPDAVAEQVEGDVDEEIVESIEGPTKKNLPIPPVASQAKAAVTGLWVGVVTLVLFLRVFAVSGWNWEVAAAVIDSVNFDDAISIFLGTLFERPGITGALVAVLLPVAISRDYWLARAHALRSRASNGFVVLGLAATTYVLVRTFHMWWVVWVTAAMTVVLIIASIVWRKGIAHDIIVRVGKHMGFLLVLTLMYLSISVDTPWMSKERIDTDVSTYFGYVLENNPGFLKVLTDDHEVIILPDGDVLSRTILTD